MARRPAVFLDRDGVVTQLRYVAEHGRVETPLAPREVRLIRGVARCIKALQRSGFRVVLVSNQPGIAKAQLSPQTFERIRARTRQLLTRERVRFDGEYYCLHHPEAIREVYRKRCACRKPKPGLLLQAAEELGLALPASFMVGDGLVDVEAGTRAGCRTILVSHLSSLLSRVMARKQLYPSYLAEDFGEAVDWILTQEAS